MQQCLLHSCNRVSGAALSKKEFAGNNVVKSCNRNTRRNVQQSCRAGMGIGFTKELIIPSNQPQIQIPSSAYGLSFRQMAALGLTDESVAKRLEPQEVCIPLVNALHPSHAIGSYFCVHVADTFMSVSCNASIGAHHCKGLLQLRQGAREHKSGHQDECWNRRSTWTGST